MTAAKIEIVVNPHGGWQITADVGATRVVCYATTIDLLVDRVREIAMGLPTAPAGSGK